MLMSTLPMGIMPILPKSWALYFLPASFWRLMFTPSLMTSDPNTSLTRSCTGTMLLPVFLIYLVVLSIRDCIFFLSSFITTSSKLILEMVVIIIPFLFQRTVNFFHVLTSYLLNIFYKHNET